MNILFSVHAYKPAWRVGGPIISVSALAERLVARGHEVTVLTTDSNLGQTLDVPKERYVDVNGVQVRYFRRYESSITPFFNLSYFRKSSGYLYAPEMAHELSKIGNKFDIMHTHLPFIYPTLAVARAAKKFRTPLFYHQRGVLDPARLRFRSLKKRAYIWMYERDILEQATTLIALTEAEVESYRALGVKSRVEVIPNGIDLPKTLGLSSKAFTIEELDIKGNHFVLLFLGRLHPTKGVIKLLRAFAKFAKDARDAVLVLAGPDEFGLTQQLIAEAERDGITNRVRFPGMITGVEKNAILERADLFCLPSDAEGFSMAVLEALAFKTPVVISPRCYFTEVERFGAGWVVPPDEQALLHSFREAYQQRRNLPRMGEAGYRLVSERYTWDAVVDRLLTVYREGIERFRRLQPLP